MDFSAPPAAMDFSAPPAPKKIAPARAHNNSQFGVRKLVFADPPDSSGGDAM